MAFSVSSVQHNGGFLPGIILLTQCFDHRGTRLKMPWRGFVFAAYDPTWTFWHFCPWPGDAQKVYRCVQIFLLNIQCCRFFFKAVRSTHGYQFVLGLFFRLPSVSVAGPNCIFRHNELACLTIEVCMRWASGESSLHKNPTPPTLSSNCMFSSSQPTRLGEAPTPHIFVAILRLKLYQAKQFCSSALLVQALHTNSMRLIIDWLYVR